jgi:hypothetical protein
MSNSIAKGKRSMQRFTVSAAALVFAGLVSGQAGAQSVPAAEKKPVTLDALRAEINALKAPKVAWREIDWKSCLLEGLREARAKSKPALLWVFIDRPIDDERC